jgi:DNA-binding Xre family transcriptional regulator
MKLKVDTFKLRSLMHERGIKSYKQLARESGVSLNCLWIELNRTGSMSRENLWLISDRLGCNINDFVYPEWEQNDKNFVNSTMKKG